jgi:hypothetical protein
MVNYYSDVFTPATWRAFVADGAAVTAFSGNAMAKRAEAIDVGDRFLCYMRGKFAWVGALEATSKAYRSDDPIWGVDSFPVRVAVKPLALLPEDQALSISELEGKVSFYAAGQYRGTVPSYFQGSPRRLKSDDGEVVLRALLAHEDGARVRVPEPEPDAVPEGQALNRSAHAEMQWILADFGIRTGCQVWVPKGDRQALNRVAESFDLNSLLADLPMVFGGHVQETVRNIDVLWLSGRTVLAAFEVENTTSIYSGLLRMSDLVAEFPNVNFPLYVVAPSERRASVRQEIVRPTFNALPQPLSRAAGFISYERLRELFSRFSGSTAGYVNAKIIETIAEKFDA